MTVQLDWPSDVVDRLTEEAQEKGLSLDAYLLQAVLNESSPISVPAEADSKENRQAAAARIREIQQRVKPDPEGWTSRDYINYGRR